MRDEPMLLGVPEGWIFPTSVARKMHFFEAEHLRSACGNYARTRGTAFPLPSERFRCKTCFNKMSSRKEDR